MSFPPWLLIESKPPLPQMTSPTRRPSIVSLPDSRQPDDHVTLVGADQRVVAIGPDDCRLVPGAGLCRRRGQDVRRCRRPVVGAIGIGNGARCPGCFDRLPGHACPDSDSRSCRGVGAERPEVAANPPHGHGPARSLCRRGGGGGENVELASPTDFLPGDVEEPVSVLGPGDSFEQGVLGVPGRSPAESCGVEGPRRGGIQAPRSPAGGAARRRAGRVAGLPGRRAGAVHHHPTSGARAIDSPG